MVIKVGAQGSLLYQRDPLRRWHIPPYSTTVVDVTGTGDASCGGFMVDWDETGDPALAACYGAVSSSFVLQGFGALYATQFSRADAQPRLEEMRGRVLSV